MTDKQTERDFKKELNIRGTYISSSLSGPELHLKETWIGDVLNEIDRLRAENQDLKLKLARSRADHFKGGDSLQQYNARVLKELEKLGAKPSEPTIDIDEDHPNVSVSEIWKPKPSEPDLVAELEMRHPYPEDVFPVMTEGDWDKVKDVLQYNRLSIDSVSGNLMRMGYNVAVDKLRHILEERKDGE